MPAGEVGDGVAGVFLSGRQGWREQPLEGSTMISAAQLLDELMGRDRNLAPDEKRSNVRWDHESVSPAGLGPVPGRRRGGRRRGLGPAGPRGSTRGGGPGPRRCRVSEPVAGGSRERGPGGRSLSARVRAGRMICFGFGVEAAQGTRGEGVTASGAPESSFHNGIGKSTRSPVIWAERRSETDVSGQGSWGQ